MAPEYKYKKSRFWIECSTTAGKIPDREENSLLLIQFKAIRRAPLVEFQTDIQSEESISEFGNTMRRTQSEGVLGEH
jgi:hypothetical protein